MGAAQLFCFCSASYSSLTIFWLTWWFFDFNYLGLSDDFGCQDAAWQASWCEGAYIINFIADTSWCLSLPLAILYYLYPADENVIVLWLRCYLLLCSLVFLYLGANSCWSSASIMGNQDGFVVSSDQSFYSMIPLTLIMFLFRWQHRGWRKVWRYYWIAGDTKIQTTRSQADQSKVEYTWTDYHDWWPAALLAVNTSRSLPGIELDTVVSRSLEHRLRGLQEILLIECWWRLSWLDHLSGYSNELLMSMFPACLRGINWSRDLLWRYRSEGGVLAQQREYELELAKSTTMSLWLTCHQTAIENPQIWEGTMYTLARTQSPSLRGDSLCQYHCKWLWWSKFWQCEILNESAWFWVWAIPKQRKRFHIMWKVKVCEIFENVKIFSIITKIIDCKIGEFVIYFPTN